MRQRLTRQTQNTQNLGNIILPLTQKIRLEHVLSKKNPVHSKAEIWFRGYGSWWLKRDLKYGGSFKNLGTRPSEVKQMLTIYPESRDGKELKVPYLMTDKMNPKGSPRDMISVDISDTEVIVYGLPIKAATGKFEVKYKR